MNDNMDQIIAEIRKVEADPHSPLLALADAYERLKGDCHREYDHIRAERDRLIQERDGGHWIHGRPSPQRAEYELLKGYWHDKWLVVEDKLRALRAELEKALNKCQQHMDERDTLLAELLSENDPTEQTLRERYENDVIPALRAELAALKESRAH